MKTFMKNLLFVPIFLTVVLFGACQEEIIEITEEPAGETITANSIVSDLMQRTASNDGSKDNIIDKSSCINLVLPLTIHVNGLEIIVDSEEDFQFIETIFDEFEDDDDLIDIVFPITIILPDHTEIIIENKEQLEEYADECEDEMEDDDIECIDFVYPITFSLFNKENNLTETKNIENDRNLYRFLKNIKESDVVSINFPISVKLSDDTVISIENLKELREAIENAKNTCDEDDDNDYGDDDFTKERLDNLLVMCPWIVHEIKRDNKSLNDKYNDYLLNFFEDGSVKVRARNGDQLTGTWSTRVSDRGALIKLDFESLADFTLEWFVYDIEKGRIKLYEDGENKIILQKRCDIIIDHTILKVENILKECLWRINKLNIEGVEHENNYLGTPIKFENENKVKLRINGEFVIGAWELVKVGERIVLKMTFEDRPELVLHWSVVLLEEGIIKLENNNSKLILKQWCENNADEDVKFINNTLTDDEWMVAKFEENDTNKTEYFNDYAIDFKSNGGVVAERNEKIHRGSWMVLRDDSKLKLELNFGTSVPFNEFNNNWKIVTVNENRIELKKYNDDGIIIKILVLEKI